MISIQKILFVVLFSGALIAGFVYFFNHNQASPELRLDGEYESESFNGPLTPEEQRVTSSDVSNMMNPHARITTNYGVITVELYNDQMPVTTGNFVELAQSGFYDNTKFHRIIQGFMIQGGDPNTKSADSSTYGTGGPGYTIQDEFVAGAELSNVRGTISMANTGQPNSGGSQFFINLGDNSGLDFDKQPLTSKHPVFGRIIEGMDVVDAIARVETGERDIPVEPVVIESVEIVEAAA